MYFFLKSPMWDSISKEVVLLDKMPACNFADLRETISQLTPNQHSGSRNTITDDAKCPLRNSQSIW